MNNNPPSQTGKTQVKKTMTAAAAVMALAMVACGSNGGSPTSPSQPKAVTPNYAANWSGNYTVTGCQATGFFLNANYCGQMTGSLPYGLNLQQSSTSVSGSFALGSIQFPTTGGTVASDGSLALQGTKIDGTITIVADWALHHSGNGITGTVQSAWTSTGLSGRMTLSGSIANSLRSTYAMAPEGANSSVPRPLNPFELLQAFTGK